MKDVWDILTLPDPSPNKKVRWFARSQHGNLGGIATSPEDLENVARLSDRGYDCYVTLNPTNDRLCKRIRSEDVTAWAFVLIDLDPLISSHNAKNIAEDLRFEIAEFLHPELCKAAIIDTGRGAQLWIRLSPVDARMPAFNKAQQATKAWLQRLAEQHCPDGWRIDNLSDLARVARLPGTINQKTGFRGKLVDPGLISTSSVASYILSYWLPTSPHQSTLVPQSHDKSWEDVINEITTRAKFYIFNGAYEGNRHESCFACCKSLWENEVSKASAWEALTYGDAASEEPLGAKVINEILNQVYGRKE